MVCDNEHGVNGAYKLVTVRSMYAECSGTVCSCFCSDRQEMLRAQSMSLTLQYCSVRVVPLAMYARLLGKNSQLASVTDE